MVGRTDTGSVSHDVARPWHLWDAASHPGHHAINTLLSSLSTLNITNPSRRPSTEDPTFDTYLPVDDQAWDEGVR